jgi:hypothetical protein
MAAFGTFTPIPAGPDGRRIRAPIYRATRPAISKRKNKVLDSSDEETWSLSSEDEDEQVCTHHASPRKAPTVAHDTYMNCFVGRFRAGHFPAATI